MNTLSTSDQLDLDQLLHQMVGDDAAVGWCEIDPVHTHSLTMAEAALVDRAVPKRQAEFASGRRLLRDLMGAHVEILRAANRAPLFPAGIVGSLSHDDEIVLGLLAPTSSMQAVGIDVEPTAILDQATVDLIVRPDDAVPDALVAFVAKEAAYKVWSVLGGEILEHHDVRIVVDEDRFSADLRGELVLNGTIGHAAGRVIACVLSPAR